MDDEGSGRKPRRRLPRILAISAGSAVVLGGLAMLVAATVLQGERLGRLLTRSLPSFAGKVEVGSVTWSAGLFVGLISDAPTPIVLENVRITDPEGQEVLRAPRIEAKVRPRSALGLKIYLRDVKLGRGSFWRFARMSEREGIGFLRWFQILDEPGAPPPPKQDDSSFVFQIENMELDGLTALFDFPDAWGLELRDIKAPGSLIVEGDFVGFDVKNLVARGGGYLRVLDDVLPFDRVEVNRVATTREAPDDILLDVKAGNTGRSVLIAAGRFTGIYGYGVPVGAPEPLSGIKMHGEIVRAADALAAVARRRGIQGLSIAGDEAQVSVDLADVFERLKIKGSAQGLDLSYGTLAAQQLAVGFALDLGEPMSVLLERLQFQAPGGGGLELTGSLRGTKAEARLALQRFTTDSYLPPSLRKLAAGTVHGGLRVAGDLQARSVAVDGMNLELRRRWKAGAPQVVRLSGQASATPTSARTERVVLKVPGATVTASGRFGVARRILGLGLRAVADDLPTLLGALGLPPLARSADLKVDLGGSVFDPQARGTLVVRGVGLGKLRPIGELAAKFRVQEGTAHLESLDGEAFGGRVQASGSARLWRGTVARMLAAPVVDLRLMGQQIDLGTLVAGGLVAGKVDVEAKVHGPVTALEGTVRLPPGAELLVLGEKWRLEGIEVVADSRAAVLRTGKLVRPAGGEVELTGRMAYDGAMQWQITARDLPLEALPGVKGSGVPASGRLSLSLAVSGTASAPLLQGQLALAGVSARGVKLGDGVLRFSPTADGGVAVDGQLFNRLTLTGTAHYGAGGPRVKATAQFRELVLEELLPEITAFGGARGKTSGKVDVDWGTHTPLTIALALDQLELSAARSDLAPGDGAAKRFFLRNASDIKVAFTGGALVVEPARFTTDGGEVKLHGEVRDDRVTGEIDGSLNLELLQPFIADRVESLGGAIDFSLRVAGTPRRPVGEGQLRVTRPITLRLPGVVPTLTLASAELKLNPAGLDLRQVVLEAEGARLTLAGQAAFDARQNVSSMQLTVGGELSGALLEAVAGGVVTEAKGRAQVSGRLWGTPAAPAVAARVRLAGLGFRVRDLGRDLTFDGGEVELATDRLVLHKIDARVDGYGQLRVGAETPGRVTIRRLWPLDIGDIKVPVSGRRLSLRLSKAVELDDVGMDLSLVGSPQAGLRLEGQVLIASARYLRDFTMRNLVISPSIDESEVREPLDSAPLLEHMKLELRVRTVGDSFMVKNNLAPELHASVDLLVHGTVGAPLIAGEIRPTDGRFHIPGVRGDFELEPNVNHITFVDTKSIDKGDTPELNLEAQSIVTDATNREHLVQMRVSGPIGQAQVDLSTNTGLDRNQALLLLVSGRTSEDEASFGAGTNPTLGANVRTGTDVIDQLARDSVADFLEPYIDDTLQSLTGGWVNLRPTVGPEGFEVRIDARKDRQFDLQLSMLRGLENRRQYRGQTSVWIYDYLTITGLAERLTYTPQEGIIENRDTIRLGLSLDLPVRPFLK